MVTEADERAKQYAVMPPPYRAWILPTILAILLALVIGWAIGLYSDCRMPADGSADAGFARDMSIHHTQAVEMALIARDRTNDDQIRILCTDILLTQQNQIGRMEGWLGAWGLQLSGDEPSMSWMGHRVEGRMPGMASPEELAELWTLPPDEMNVFFLQLMIVHHRSGIDMAEAALERADRAEVRRLAESIVATQASEIRQMQVLLDQIGG